MIGHDMFSQNNFCQILGETVYSESVGKRGWEGNWTEMLNGADEESYNFQLRVYQIKSNALYVVEMIYDG